MKDGPLNIWLTPLKCLEYLKTHSPSRKHGVSEKQEQQWKRSCVNLIIKTGLKIQMYAFNLTLIVVRKSKSLPELLSAIAHVDSLMNILSCRAIVFSVEIT